MIELTFHFIFHPIVVLVAQVEKYTFVNTLFRLNTNKQNTNITTMMRQALSLAILTLFCFTSCDKDENNGYDVPATYTFTDADGNNTVSFTGQTQRKAMLSELVATMKKGNTGEVLDGDQLQNMFSNTNSPFSDASLNTASKDIKSKTAGGDINVQQWFQTWMAKAADASSKQAFGSNGVAGVVGGNPGQGGPYLQDEEGKEYVQMVEKGLMGALMIYQIEQVYMGDDRIGSSVNNTDAVDAAAGKFYTAKEHHWDEAYGYFTDAIDYPATGTDSYWGKYTNGRDDLLGSNAIIAGAFRTGRAALSAGVEADLLAARDEIRTELTKVCAATAIHYLNEATNELIDDAARNHALSEAYPFIWSLRFAFDSPVTAAEGNELHVQLGNYYTISATDIKTVRDTLSTAAGLDDVKDQL